MAGFYLRRIARLPAARQQPLKTQFRLVNSGASVKLRHRAWPTIRYLNNLLQIRQLVLHRQDRAGLEK